MDTLNEIHTQIQEQHYKRKAFFEMEGTLFDMLANDLYNQLS